MDERTMPLTVFRCVVCGVQEAHRLDKLVREMGRADKTKPAPRHHDQPMIIVQMDYES